MCVRNAGRQECNIRDRLKIRKKAKKEAGEGKEGDKKE